MVPGSTEEAQSEPGLVTTPAGGLLLGRAAICRHALVGVRIAAVMDVRIVVPVHIPLAEIVATGIAVLIEERERPTDEASGAAAEAAEAISRPPVRVVVEIPASAAPYTEKAPGSEDPGAPGYWFSLS